MNEQILIPQAVAQCGVDYLVEHGYRIKMGTGRDEESVARDVKGCSAILLRTAPVTRKVIEAEPALKIVARHGAGYDNIDIAAAEEACRTLGVHFLTGKIATGDQFVGDSATKAAIAAKCAPDCVEMEGAAVSQIAARNGIPCVVLRAMSDNADEKGHEKLVVKNFSIAEYVATATAIVHEMMKRL